MIEEKAGSKKKRLLNLLKFSFTIGSTGLFIWILSRLDWDILLQSIRHLPWWILPISIALYFSAMVANTYRWSFLLSAQGVDLSFKQLFKIVLVGAFVSNFLPSTIGGDAIRVVNIYRITANKTISVSSVIVDRIVNLAAMMTILPFSLLTFGSPIAFIKGLSGMRRNYSYLSFVTSGRKILDIFGKPYNKIRDALANWLNHPISLIRAFIAAWISVFVVFIAIWLIARGLGIEVALYQVMGVTAITYVLSLLPISVNGYGLREVSFTALYVYLGASIELAVSLALITRLITMIETLPGALWLTESLSLAKKQSI